MNIIVFGANGKVGSLVVEKLLHRGHNVTAFVYGKSPYQETATLHVCSGDVKNEEDVREAIKGHDAVISALGSWGTKTKDILSSGMRRIIPAMEQEKIKRIVSLTGSAAHTSSDTWGFAGKLTHAIFGMLAPKIIQDAEAHIKLLAASNLNWTVIRSPIMNDSGSPSYQLNSHLPGAIETINRHAVAKALVDQIDDTRFFRQLPHIHRAKNETH